MLQQNSVTSVPCEKLERSVDSNMNKGKTKGLTNSNSDGKSLGKLVCHWLEWFFFFAVCCNFFVKIEGVHEHGLN